MTKEELLERLNDIEWNDFEVKDASGGLPKSMWETVSAFSNTAGGWIILGVKEIKIKSVSTYEVVGIDNMEKMEQDISSILRSDSKFNVPIISHPHSYKIDGKTVLAYYIPVSDCRPVYLNHNLNNTYIRVGTGDQRATDIEIGILMREKTFGNKSDMVVKGTSLADLNPNSLETYRRRVRDFNPDLPFNSLADTDFCEKIAISDNGELTFGGLLMFGRRDVIIKNIRNFWIDYREIPGTSYTEAETRYTFRMQEQENIWEYFQLIFERLRNFVDNPFMAGPDGYSPEDNSQLYCLREGLVNMLAHADYFSPIHSTVIVYSDKIEFQNPGQFPIKITGKRGKVKSVPRNPNIITFFRYARQAENAGYGIDRILLWKQLTTQEVEIDTELSASTVTYYRPLKGHEKKPIEDTSTRYKIFELIRHNPKITRKAIASETGLSLSNVQYHLDQLKSSNIIKRIGTTRGYWEIISDMTF